MKVHSKKKKSMQSETEKKSGCFIVEARDFLVRCILRETREQGNTRKQGNEKKKEIQFFPQKIITCREVSAKSLSLQVTTKNVKTGEQYMSLVEKTDFPFFVFPYFRVLPKTTVFGDVMSSCVKILTLYFRSIFRISGDVLQI